MEKKKKNSLFILISTPCNLDFQEDDFLGCLLWIWSSRQVVGGCGSKSQCLAIAPLCTIPFHYWCYDFPKGRFNDANFQSSALSIEFA